MYIANIAPFKYYSVPSKRCERVPTLACAHLVAPDIVTTPPAFVFVPPHTLLPYISNSFVNIVSDR